MACTARLTQRTPVGISVLSGAPIQRPAECAAPLEAFLFFWESI